MQTCFRLVGGIFLDCEETKAFNAINGLVSFFVDDNAISDINYKLDKILKKLDVLSLKEIGRPLQDGKTLTELENDWEPYIRIQIDNQNFIAFCDIGSMLSTMPKIVYDSIKCESMIDYPFYHPHANESISKIIGKG